MWRISADTGGTFTDCYAVTPEGSELRCKVLSTGCIRARIVQAPSGAALRLEDAWKTPDHLFVGFQAILPLCPDEQFTVIGSHQVESDLMLRFDRRATNALLERRWR